jgi:hypothetical protein
MGFCWTNQCSPKAISIIGDIIMNRFNDFCMSTFEQFLWNPKQFRDDALKCNIKLQVQKDFVENQKKENTAALQLFLVLFTLYMTLVVTMTIIDACCYKHKSKKKLKQISKESFN